MITHEGRINGRMQYRRRDLAIPYLHRPDKPQDAPPSTLYRALPMVAMFMRSKALAWTGLFLCVQAYVSQPFETGPNDDVVSIQHIATAVMSVAVSYMDFVIAPGRK